MRALFVHQRPNLLLLVALFVALLVPLTLFAQEEQSRLTIATPYGISTLDPIKSIAGGDIEIFGQLYSRLLRRTPQGELEPGLAESWEVSDDGLTYTFDLREAQFSDGSPITVDDVVFSYLRMRDQEDSAYSGSFQVIEDVVALDEDTVQFTLSAPTAPFLSLTEIFNTGIVPQAYVEEVGDEEFATNPVTSGPYMVREWLPNDRLILERNPYYWREGYPHFDVVEFIEVTNAQTRVSMIQAGEVDVAREIPWVSVDVLKQQEGIVVPLEPSSVISIVLINHEDEVLGDPRVRQAMMMAIDIPAIVQAVTFGYATPATSLLPNTLDYFASDLEVPPYDMERARALIEEAGATGATIEFMVTGSGTFEDQVTTLMQNELSQIGLNVTITQVDGGTWWDRLIGGNYDATLSWWYNETTDPDLAIRWALCGACGNLSFYTRYNNEHLNELADEALHETDPERRGELYREIQQIALEEVAQIPLAYQPYRNAYSADIEGLMMTPSLQWTIEEAHRIE